MEAPGSKSWTDFALAFLAGVVTIVTATAPHYIRKRYLAAKEAATNTDKARSSRFELEQLYLSKTDLLLERANKDEQEARSEAKLWLDKYLAASQTISDLRRQVIDLQEEVRDLREELKRFKNGH